MRPKQQHTIAAVSSAPGKGAIAIVRLSGEKAIEIAKKLLGVKNEPIPEKIKRYILSTENIKDDVTAVFYKAPKSYTGEDAVEIFCHGNNSIAEEIVEECIRNGARVAENGEFTKRAFLNNKIDLTQAEGIIDIINAESRAGINAAFSAVEGFLFKEIELIQKEILSMIAEAGAAVDYPEENIEEITSEQLVEKIKPLIGKTQYLKESYDSGKVMRDGIRVAIVGEPNVGKSMLLNGLLGRDRAIVTDIEGTTRDTLEEAFEYRGIKFIFIDTAGIRETSDKIEKVGIERSYRAIDEADLILSVTEPNKNYAPIETKNKKIIKILNKSDIFSFGYGAEDITNDNADIFVSAKTGENIDKLKELIYNVSCKDVSASGAILTNARQYSAVKNAHSSLERALLSAENNLFDCIISDLNEAYRTLGTVTGAYASDDVVNEIFSRFCVGK